jgi:hypothetical protein
MVVIGAYIFVTIVALLINEIKNIEDEEDARYERLGGLYIKL